MKYDKHLKKLTHKERKSLMEKDVQENKQIRNKTKQLIDELVILDDCVFTGTFKWRSEIDPNWTPRVWNETFECWTKDYCG